jgi:hypothetical protein
MLGHLLLGCLAFATAVLGSVDPLEIQVMRLKVLVLVLRLN